MKKVYIGKGVSRIERGLFEKCPNLETVVIDPQNPYFKSEGGLILKKDGKTLVRGWGKVDKIPDSVETIQYLAFFQNQHLEALEIPESVKEIEWEAFYDCNNLKTVSIPASVSVIGQRAFYRCEKNSDTSCYLNKVHFSFKEQEKPQEIPTAPAISLLLVYWELGSQNEEGRKEK